MVDGQIGKSANQQIPLGCSSGTIVGKSRSAVPQRQLSANPARLRFGDNSRQIPLGRASGTIVSKSDTRPGRQRLDLLSVGLLALAFGAMGMVNIGRAVQSRLNITLLAGWEFSLSPQVLLAFSVGWAVIFLAAAWGLWRRCRWGLGLGLWLPPVYGLYSVGVILLFTCSSYARGRWALVAAGWTAGTLVIRWLLTRARIHIQFTRKE